ncbi:hypothetical protein B0H11DRAFT_2214403 [Mycena galericulata]|nr:hypothetical protein B0H11DRAFT_2214403 [Mycena galericulata]
MHARRCRPPYPTPALLVPSATRASPTQTRAVPRPLRCAPSPHSHSQTPSKWALQMRVNVTNTSRRQIASRLSGYLPARCCFSRPGPLLNSGPDLAKLPTPNQVVAKLETIDCHLGV